VGLGRSGVFGVSSRGRSGVTTSTVGSGVGVAKFTLLVSVLEFVLSEKTDSCVGSGEGEGSNVGSGDGDDSGAAEA